MTLRKSVMALAVAAAAALVPCAGALAHGDVTPQPIDVTGLEPLGEDWRDENPYRGDSRAIEIGTSGYNQNCARCHGLEVISGGIAPDLRKLELGKSGDEWFLMRIRGGARKQDGTTIMPAFEGIFSQEAMWAIRAYIETKHVDE